jgi:hypothetical protein
LSLCRVKYTPLPVVEYGAAAVEDEAAAVEDGAAAVEGEAVAVEDGAAAEDEVAAEEAVNHVSQR